jgi:hypothetical protein
MATHAAAAHAAPSTFSLSLQLLHPFRRHFIPSFSPPREKGNSLLSPLSGDDTNTAEVV